MLAQKLTEAFQKSRHEVSNSYLVFIRPAVEKIEHLSALSPTLVAYVKKLEDFFDHDNFVSNGRLTNEFAQVLGEAHFYAICLEKGITLTRLPEQDRKTPDFLLKTEKIELYFEVKTPSVVGGEGGIEKDLNNSRAAHEEIKKQIESGKKIASADSVFQPYREKPYKKGKGTITAVIDTLIEKASQNLKQGQFPNATSFLVLNLSIIPPFRTDNYVLRPAYCDDYMFKKAVTGELWMLAFGKPGMLIHGHPEFEGEAAIEGLLEKCGILTDPQYDYVSGILLMIHPWRRPTEIWGLFPSQKYLEWSDNNGEVLEKLLTLVRDNWNDEVDSNGWTLQG